MTHFPKSKNSSHKLTFTVIAGALLLVSSCSHKESTDSDTDTDKSAAASSDVVAAPAAGTDAAPSDTAQTSPASPTTQTAETTPTAASTDGTEPPARHKGKKHIRPHVKATETALNPQNAAALSALAHKAVTPPPAITQPQGIDQRAPVAITPPPPVAAMTNRAPASPRNVPADTSTAELSAEGAGGMMDMFGNYRSMAMAIAGLGLIGGGGFALWKKKQGLA